MVRSRIILNLLKERRKLLRKNPITKFVIRGKVQEFQISLQKRYSAINEDEDLEVEVGGRAARQNTSKLSHETKDLIKKRQNMQVSNIIDKIELPELSK